MAQLYCRTYRGLSTHSYASVRGRPKPNFFRVTSWFEQIYGCISAKPKNSVMQYLWLKMSEYGYHQAKKSSNMVIVKHWKIQHAIFNVLFCSQFSVAVFF